jgi:hypothetical protein
MNGRYLRWMLAQRSAGCPTARCIALFAGSAATLMLSEAPGDLMPTSSAA